MGMTIDEAMEEIIKIKKTKCKEDNISDFSQALSIAFLTMKNYQILKNSYNDKLKADMVAMLTKIKLKITEKSYYDTTIIGNYEDEVRINLVELDDINDIIQEKINELMAEGEG